MDGAARERAACVLSARAHARAHGERRNLGAGWARVSERLRVPVVLLRRKADDSPYGGNPFHPWHRVRGELADDMLRFGVQFSDGSKATVFGGHPRFDVGDPPTGPVLMQRGGGGGGRSWDFGFWVWPLPPPGPLAFVVEWPSERIELSRAEIDASVVRMAAQHAEMLWPEDDDGPSSSGGVAFVRQIR